jgi:hypothetical protein
MKVVVIVVVVVVVVVVLVFAIVVTEIEIVIVIVRVDKHILICPREQKILKSPIHCCFENLWHCRCKFHVLRESLSLGEHELQLLLNRIPQIHT